ncbi:MAG: hypothetical protein ISN64_00620 [Rickettsia sp.]|nr:hypothetical protein [Rickettsia sp.]
MSMSDDKIFLSSSIGIDIFFPGDILHKFPTNYESSKQGKYYQNIELPNIRTTIGYKLSDKLDLTLSAGWVIKHSFSTKTNLVDGMHLKYVSSFLNIGDMNKLFFSKNEDTDQNIKNLFNKSEVVLANISMKMTPVYLGLNYNLLEKENWTFSLHSNIGISFLNTESSLNINFSEMIGNLRTDKNLEKKFQIWSTKRKEEKKIQEEEKKKNSTNQLSKSDMNTDLPQRILNEIINNSKDLTKISKSFDYKVKFEQKSQFFISNGFNLSYSAYSGVEIFSSFMIDYLFKIDNLEIKYFSNHDNKVIKNDIDQFWNINYSNNCWNKKLEINEDLLSFRLNLGIRFLF